MSATIVVTPDEYQDTCGPRSMSTRRGHTAVVYNILRFLSAKCKVQWVQMICYGYNGVWLRSLRMIILE
eukprot:5130566-Prymnesium_polylepis.1